MAKHNLYDFLGKYSKAYKTSIIKEPDKFKEFVNSLKVFYEQINSLYSNNNIPSEETYKVEFDKHVLQKFYTNKYTHAGVSKNDLIIENNGLTQVIIEFKQPSNKDEMLQTNDDNINKKALHEAIRYFYNQDSLQKRQEIKHIIITDTEQFFFFDTQSFSNDILEKICKKYCKDNPQVADIRTKTQYKELEEEISKKDIKFSYGVFNLKKYKEKILDSNLNENDIEKLKYLYMALHRDFLLREFIPKDSNKLNSKFYNELLYILGLREENKNGKCKIVASDVSGTLRDNIYNNLYNVYKDKKFEAALQLIIVWLNRILFLKLFEAQLISFNSKEEQEKYGFFNSRKIKSFNDLNQLFFNILGTPIEDRDEFDKKEYIPYLNSALFELSEPEIKYNLKISGLKENVMLKVYKKKEEKPLLEYLLDFLESYNFSSNLSDESIKNEQNTKKDIINSSVLGLIFEKLNGYKDGSFFTPAYITEYMAKNSIDKTVIQKYKENFPDSICGTIEDLKEHIERDNNFTTLAQKRNFYNAILFDNLKICDPAVGSGHFLVSILNYIIALKSKLKLLNITNTIEVLNDSLVIYDGEDGKQFQYKRNKNREDDNFAVQKTIFNEKRRIIENCLFGVDINPNSVEICRLRLWIELLKSTYYIGSTDEMQTLPNIDINIKFGNSLANGIDFSVGKAIPSSLGKSITEEVNKYKDLVAEYKKTSSKEIKQKVHEKIKSIYNKLQQGCTVQLQLTTDDIIKENLKQAGKIAKAKYNIIENSFEWAIVFPEMLDDNGVFVGFDIVIGNPPYFNVETYGAKHEIVDYLKTKYSDIWMDKSDILFYFIKRAYELTKNNVSFIISNAFLFSDKAQKLRSFLLNKMSISEIINFEKFMVFESASITTCIISLEKNKPYKSTKILNFKEKEIQLNDLYTELENGKRFYEKTFENDKVFSLEDNNISKINNKIDSNYKKLGKILKVGSGMQTAANSVFCFSEYPNQFPPEYIKYRMSGEIISKYYYKKPNEYLLYFENINSFEELPLSVQEHLLKNKNYLESRATVRNENRTWWRYSRPVHREYYMYDKIWCSYRAKENAFVYDDTQDYIGLTNTTVIFGTSNEYNLKYVLALLNSKLLNFRYKSIGKQTGNGIFEYFENQISKLPIPYISCNEQQKFIGIVDNILDITKSADYSNNIEKQQAVKEYEKQIDIMVYKLYNLAYNEVLTVDKEIDLTEENYNNFKL